ncbi:MAG TPA: DUF805 domain-containing protein [Desulfarculaceae bacterium]|nr:DUF805 domain-containing protein [Desulfarculaceae bacterium]
MNLKALLFSFHGRINRLPYWVVTLILAVWGGLFQQFMGPYGPDHPMTAGPGLVTGINFVIVLWIALAVQVKRWHDRDKSGWWMLINIVPIIGQIWLFIECGLLRGTAGENRFGRDLISPSQ